MDACGQACCQPLGAHLVDAQVNPQAVGGYQLQHVLPGHHGAARLGLARNHQAVLRRAQQQVGALGLQRAAIGLHAGALLACRRQGRLGHLEFLAAHGQGFFAGGASSPQLGVALRLRGGKLLACLGFAHVGVAALQRSRLGVDALLQIHWLHGGQQLPGTHVLAHIHVHLLHAPGHGGANAQGVARLHRANAKHRRLQGAALGQRLCHGHRRQRAGAQRHVAQQRGQGHEHGQHRQGATLQGKAFHVGSPSGGQGRAGDAAIARR